MTLLFRLPVGYEPTYSHLTILRQRCSDLPVKSLCMFRDLNDAMDHATNGVVEGYAPWIVDAGKVMRPEHIRAFS